MRDTLLELNIKIMPDVPEAFVTDMVAAGKEVGVEIEWDGTHHPRYLFGLINGTPHRAIVLGGKVDMLATCDFEESLEALAEKHAVCANGESWVTLIKSGYMEDTFIKVRPASPKTPAGARIKYKLVHN